MQNISTSSNRIKIRQDTCFHPLEFTNMSKPSICARFFSIWMCIVQHEACENPKRDKIHVSKREGDKPVYLRGLISLVGPRVDLEM